jgi:hypothetical protein
VDAAVPVGMGTVAVPLRLVGVPTPTGDGVVRTNRPPRIGPRHVSDRERVRWEGERSIRLDHSVNWLDALDPEPPCPLKTRVPAALIASTLAALRAPTHTVQIRPQPPGAPRPEAPLHPRRLALPLALSGPSIAQALALTGTEATPRENKSAAWLTQRGKAPNGRRRPSVLDQLRGWKRQPLTRKKPNSGHVSHGRERQQLKWTRMYCEGKPL